MKKIHIYHLNKIKETLAKLFNAEASEEPDKRKVYCYERNLRHWIDKAQLSDDEWIDLPRLLIGITMIAFPFFARMGGKS